MLYLPALPRHYLIDVLPRQSPDNSGPQSRWEPGLRDCQRRWPPVAARARAPLRRPSSCRNVHNAKRYRRPVGVMARAFRRGTQRVTRSVGQGHPDEGACSILPGNWLELGLCSVRHVRERTRRQTSNIQASSSVLLVRLASDVQLGRYAAGAATIGARLVVKTTFRLAQITTDGIYRASPHVDVPNRGCRKRDMVITLDTRLNNAP